MFTKKRKKEAYSVSTPSATVTYPNFSNCKDAINDMFKNGREPGTRIFKKYNCQDRMMEITGSHGSKFYDLDTRLPPGDHKLKRNDADAVILAPHHTLDAGNDINHVNDRDRMHTFYGTDETNRVIPDLNTIRMMRQNNMDWVRVTARMPWETWKERACMGIDRTQPAGPYIPGSFICDKELLNGYCAKGDNIAKNTCRDVCETNPSFSTKCADLRHKFCSKDHNYAKNTWCQDWGKRDPQMRAGADKWFLEYCNSPAGLNDKICECINPSDKSMKGVAPYCFYAPCTNTNAWKIQKMENAQCGTFCSAIVKIDAGGNVNVDKVALSQECDSNSTTNNVDPTGNGNGNEIISGQKEKQKQKQTNYLPYIVGGGAGLTILMLIIMMVVLLLM